LTLKTLSNKTSKKMIIPKKSALAVQTPAVAQSPCGEVSARKVWIKTYGCQMNERDSDTLKTLLIEAGFLITDREAEADIALLNTCSVREMAEQKALGKAGRLLKNKRSRPDYKVGILGCMAANRQGTLFHQLPGLDLVVPPQSLHQLPQLLRRTLAQSTPLACPASNGYNFQCYEHPSPQGKPSISVPIQQGCSMACSFCIVPHTRGPQQNRPFDSILREVVIAAQNGTREVTLLGQIVNAYRDPHSPRRFVDLLRALQAIEPLKRIRFISPHPSFFSPQLIQAFQELPKLCPAVHLPVQSGSDRLLKAMGRPYQVSRLLDIIETLRRNHPQMSISTDIIVGYPGETEADFQATVQLFHQAKFDMAYIFKFSPRPFTQAASQTDPARVVPDSVKEERNQVLLQLLHQYSSSYNQQFVGSHQEILIEGPAPRGEGKLFGKSVHNKKVIVSGPSCWIHSFQSAYIQRATSSTLEGTVQ
jgi:tRNA-2-methylthio-N6-dimethylallyladenosine synthase